MPLQATSGAASYDAFGGGVPVVPNYIEQVFSTYLYAGNGSTQTITNGIDLSGQGGMTWIKGRNLSFSHAVFDTVRGATNRLVTNVSDANSVETGTLTAFNSDGFSLGSTGAVNSSSGTFASWTFRKQPKFFDVVTYTGNGAASRNIAHNLGSTPGCIIGKTLSISENWGVYHRSTGANGLYLNATNSAGVTGVLTGHTSTTFEVGNGYGIDNSSGVTYVAYLFAHNAGGFGLTGTDNVISCGSFTGATTINLGYEPQWVLVKGSDTATNWSIQDNMRGLTADGTGSKQLFANLSNAESNADNIKLNATGFTTTSSWAGVTAIYIAIRRGPMRVPTVGTSVFAPSTAAGEPSSSPLFTAGFSDMTLHSPRVSESGNGHLITDRLRGNGVILETPYTSAENTSSTYFKYDSNNGAYIPNLGYFNNTGGTSKPYALRAFKRAPSFFDEVCYLGNGSTQNVSHNLGVVPELMIVKSRSLADSDWWVYSSALTTPQNKYLRLQSTDGESTATGLWGSSLPTSTTFGLGAFAPNSSGATFVAYLFATCAGVSKVGSYTGNGSSQTINCGFTGGARFVLIKKSSGTGDWMVSDSARGIVSGNDPYLELNNTNAEVTGEDWLDTDSTGFVVNEVSGSNANTNGATYIFLAIA